MNVIEIITFFTAFLFLVNLFFDVKKNIFNTLFALLTLLTSLMSILYGARWVYFSLYFFIFLCLFLKFKLNILNSLHKMKKKYKTFSFLFLFILISISFSFSFIFPIRELPKPSGDFMIGTRVFDVIDKERKETYDEESDKRKFKIQVWYPIDNSENLKKALWLYDGKAQSEALSKDSGLPGFVFDHLSAITSNSYIEAELSNKIKKYPIIIISHGWRSLRNLHQDIAEEMASQGFIVFGIDHSYGSVKTIFSDGSYSEINYDALPSGVSEDFFLKKANKLINTYADDIKKSVDYIIDLNKTNEFFKGKLDTEKIGLIGHSTGGGAVVREAISDKRIKSLVGLDAWVEPIKEQNIKKGLQIPSLFFRSMQWESGKNNINLELLFKHSEIKPSVYQIKDTGHYDFSMVYMFTSISKLIGVSGKINDELLNSLMKNNITEFFKHTLKEGAGIKFNIKNNDSLSDVSKPWY